MSWTTIEPNARVVIARLQAGETEFLSHYGNQGYKFSPCPLDAQPIDRFDAGVIRQWLEHKEPFHVFKIQEEERAA